MKAYKPADLDNIHTSRFKNGGTAIDIFDPNKPSLVVGISTGINFYIVFKHRLKTRINWIEKYRPKLIGDL